MSSLFHASINRAIKIKEGIRCIIKPIIWSQSVNSGLNASRANKLIKRIARIHKTRGSQYSNLVDIFIIFIFNHSKSNQ
jgi:hypothetical protein